MASRTPRDSPRRRRKWLLALLGPIVFLVVLEALLRLAGVSPPVVERPFPGFGLGLELAVEGDEPPFVRHPTRFFQPRPNQRGVFRTDAHGFRGPDRPPAHPALYRVAVVGDSTTFGFGVRYAASFCGILQDRLSRRLPGLEVDVLNAGCYAYSTWQNRIDLQERVLPLEPDVVVLAITGFNDSLGAIGLSDREWSRLTARATVPVLRLLRSSRLYAALERLVLGVQERVLIGDANEAARAVLEGGAPSGRRVPLDEFSENLEAMLQAVRASGAEPILFVHHPREDHLRADPEARAYLEAVLGLDARCERLDGAAAVSPDDASLYYDKVHPNERGHERLAELLFPILEAHAPPSPSGPERSLTAVGPPQAWAGGGDELTIEGSAIDGGPGERVFVGGEPAEIVHASAGTLRVVAPPCRPGPARVLVSGRRGSVWLDRAVRVVGPRLAVRRSGSSVTATISGRPHERYRLHVSRGPGQRLSMLGRVFGLDPDRAVGREITGELDDRGLAELTVPLPDDAPDLYAQAWLEPTSGPYPRILLETETVLIEGARP